MKELTIALIFVITLCSTIFAQDGLKKGNAVATAPKQEFAGDKKSKKTILVAWSFDDGPANQTDALRKEMGINNVTLFIVKKAMLEHGDKWEKNLAKYKAFQDQGSEIAIHAQHKTVDHILWFPAKTKTKHKSYNSIEEAMKDFSVFQKELTDAKIRLKFTRLPGGLVSQFISYSNHLGFGKNSSKVARAVVKNMEFETLGLSGTKKELAAAKVKFEKMAADLATMKRALKANGTLLWNGDSNPSHIDRQSWQAECSGTLELNDTVTLSVTHLEKRGGKKYLKYCGEFEKRVDKLKNDGDLQSLVILSHDNKSKHVDEIIADMKVMDSYAKAKGVKIEFVTMSTLFKRITGKDPATFTPEY